MPANTLAYMRLVNSNSTLDVKFRVVQGSLRHPVQKTQTRGRTVTGKADTQEGAHIAMHSMTLKVRHTESLGGYGTLANLKTFYSYKNPNATPSTQITYYENLDEDGNGTGDAHTVEMVGDWDPEMVTYVEHGASGWFYAPILLEETG